MNVVNGLLVVYLLTLTFSVYGQQCPDPVCHDEWDVDVFPDPRKESGLCGRGCDASYVCDPCQVLSSQEGKPSKCVRGSGIFFYGEKRGSSFFFFYFVEGGGKLLIFEEFYNFLSFIIYILMNGMGYQQSSTINMRGGVNKIQIHCLNVYPSRIKVKTNTI